MMPPSLHRWSEVWGLRDPVSDVFQGRRLELAGPPLRHAAARDQARALEHLEVLRDGGKAHPEGLRQLGDRSLPRRESGEDRAPRRVGESREGGGEAIGRHGNEPVG
jgi:hypothetical protein